MTNYLAETELLDFSHPSIERLLGQWQGFTEFDKIGTAYDFVRNQVAFGYNSGDHIRASEVLADGYGQCNTKGTLLMALLRGLGIPCRYHGFTIDKSLQKGAMTGWVYWLAPQEIIHSWVEVYYDGTWQHLEGFILDRAYLDQLQTTFKDCQGSFCGYGAAVDNLQDPPIEWEGGSTYIQHRGIRQDFGIYNDPDSFFSEKGQALSPLKDWVYRHIARHLMNRNVNKMRRKGQLPA